MSRNTWMALALIGALVINTIMHFSHPAYRFYKDTSKLQDKKYDEFVKRVEKEFAPAIINSISNIAEKSSISSSPAPAPITTSAASSMFGRGNSDKDFDDDLISFLIVNNEPILKYGNFYLKAGDVLWGDIITRITPSAVFCRQNTFIIQPQKEKEKDEKEVIINNNIFVPLGGREGNLESLYNSTSNNVVFGNTLKSNK